MNSEEKDIRKNRLTVNVNDYYNEVINKLKGPCGDSISSVIYYIIKDWIINNSDKLTKVFRINFSQIQINYSNNNRNVIFDKKLNTFQRNIISFLSTNLSGIISIKINDLAEQLNIEVSHLRELFLFHYDKLKDAGINYYLDDDKIIKDI